MKPREPALLAIAIGLCAEAIAAGPPVTASLCAPQETTYFSCLVARERSVALCGLSGGGVQSRFGRAAAIELRFPDASATTTDPLRIAHYSRYQTERFEVRFENRGTDYVVFDYTEEQRRSAGVRLTMGDGKERELACAGRVHSRMNELQGLLPCDPDSALNGGSCPR